MDIPDGYHMLAPGKLATLVTYLEMTAPPPARPVPAPAGVDLRREAAPEPAAYRALFRRIGEDWMWSSRLVLDDAALAAAVTAPGTEVYVPVRDGVALGLLELDFADPADVELRYFGLVPDAVGGGLGRWLMNEAMRLVWQRPATRRFWVHTCHFDAPAALPFYIRSGFVPYARAVEVFDDPRLAGRLPRSASPQVPLIDPA